ncbi:hypothetical protein J6590_020839 [Homalodisca vitripennis]|nr:hypothetical protein J6590_020839 [Homalodisca vitripennis]
MHGRLPSIQPAMSSPPAPLWPTDWSVEVGDGRRHLTRMLQPEVEQYIPQDLRAMGHISQSALPSVSSHQKTGDCPRPTFACPTVYLADCADLMADVSRTQASKHKTPASLTVTAAVQLNLAGFRHICVVRWHPSSQRGSSFG